MSEPSQIETELSTTVKSADRVMLIFEFFARVQAPSTLIEIARELKSPASSTLALLKSMQKMGYIAQDIATKTYMPTFRLALISNWLQVLINPDGAVTRLMEDLQEKTGETIILGMQNGIYAHYIHIVQAKSLLRMYLTPGTLRPICRSSVGRVLMSVQSKEAITSLIRRVNLVQSPNQPAVKLDEVLELLTEVRSAGYSYVSNQITQGAGTYAMLLPRRGEQPQMALAIGGPASRLEENEPKILAAMREGIERYSQATAIEF